MDMNLSKLWEKVKDREPGVLQTMKTQRVRDDLVTERQQRRTYGRLYDLNHLYALNSSR